MQLRFKNAPFFDPDMAAGFKDLKDLKVYFLEFYHYQSTIQAAFRIESNARMNGKTIKDYQAKHAQSLLLEKHYHHLLTVGVYRFDFFLNDLVKQ